MSCRPDWASLALAAMLVGAPVQGLAQVADTQLRLTATASQIYDSNLFMTTLPQSDVIARFGPALDLIHTSPWLDVSARYQLFAERYLEHPELNSNTAHQEAAVAMRWHAGPRLALTVDASHVSTQTPSELNVDSQLMAGRAPAERRMVLARTMFDVTRTASVSVEHAISRDALVGGVSSTTQRVLLGVARHTGTRNRYRADYQFHHFDFGQGRPARSHVMTAAWVHELTSRTGVELSAGPRLSEGRIRPEIAALVRRELLRGDVSFSYARTEMTTIGERGTIDLQRLAATVRYRPWRRIELAAAPGVSRSRRAGLHVPVYAMDVNAVFAATRLWSVTAWSRVGHQDGTLSGASEPIRQRTLGVTVTATLPRAAAGAADGRDAKR